MTRFESKPIRKILVPLDFSDVSENALHFAGSIASVCKASVILLHVNDAPGMLVNDASLAIDFVQLNKEIESNLNQSCEIFKQSFPGVKAETRLTLGFAIQGIKETIEKEKPDLVIMGTHGAYGIKEVLIGTQTYKILDNCECPVLVIPKDAKFIEPKKVVFATNFSDHEMQQLFLMVELLRPFKPEIIVLHIDENVDHKLESRMLEYFEGQVRTSISYENFTFRELSSGGKVESALEKFIHDNQVDWIGTAKRKRNFFDMLTTKSLTKELAYHLEIPLLAFHVKVNSTTAVF